MLFIRTPLLSGLRSTGPRRRRPGVLLQSDGAGTVGSRCPEPTHLVRYKRRTADLCPLSEARWAFRKHQFPFLKYFVLSKATGHPFTLPSTLLLLDFLYILTTGAGSRKHGLGNAFWQEGFLLGVIRVLLTGQTPGAGK